ncbi:MAG: acetylxylan esterase [Phycisphaerae bacterium]|nr:acetylxylan esterase [Phycisphaerae bacterium]
MPSIDWPIEKLREYAPDLYRQPDFESFWNETRSAALHQPIHGELIRTDLPARGAECFAIRFDGFVGSESDRPGRIAGWYVRPQGGGKFPAVMHYHGYSGRGVRPLDMLALASQGIAAMSMDCRGQTGESPDLSTAEGGHFVGYMTKGILHPRQYYYRYVYADALRALEFLASRDEVDSSRLAVTGASQGGAIALAVSALSDRPILSLPDIPFLCDFRRAIDITPNNPYPEIARYLKQHPSRYDQAIRTLSYFDNLNLAPWIRCRTVISNGLWDDVCPPSTIFAVYNHITAPKQMEVYRFHGHEVPYEHRELQYRLILAALRP